jgi:Xaa-Pro aminopeptidase
MITLRKIGALRKIAFSSEGFDGYLISNSMNLLYFLGFPGASSLFIPAEGESIVYVYGVNYEQAKVECKGFKVEQVKADENLIMKIARQVKVQKTRRLAVDSLSVAGWQALVKEFPKENMLEINNGCIETLRRVKDAHEIELMRKAGELTSEGMKAAYETIKPGVKEYAVAAEIEHAMRKRGAGALAFETIVASGMHSAFPHGGCSDRTIQDGDLVVVDIGTTYNYYCSDMTRTLVAGNPSVKQQKIYNIVKDAQEKAFQTIKAGAIIADVDNAARKVIEAAGYGDYFVHRLGHGVGLEVHEPPSLSHLNKDLLVAGNVVTNEPGIYICNYGGVRIEDTVLVQRNGAEKLTTGPYRLTAE